MANMKRCFFLLMFFYCAGSSLEAEDSMKTMAVVQTAVSVESTSAFSAADPAGLPVENATGNATAGATAATETAVASPNLAEEKDLRDPFQTDLPAQEVGPAPIGVVGVDVLLQGIARGADSFYAILNGEVYYEGEEREGIKLLEVRKGEADILINGNIRTLKMLPEEEIKKATTQRVKKKKE